MFSEADHEVIDSPEALFRHLYEEHGVEEARELDPDTAPLQFWLRRHADLERAERAARRHPNQPPDPPPPPQPQPAPRPQPERARPERRTEPAPEPVRAQAPSPQDHPAPRAEPAARARPERRAQATGGGREGRRPAGFGDPLVEALARALAGRGHDEVAVRSAIRSFADPGRGPAGEAAVRSVFVEPMLQSVAEHLLGAAPRPPRPAPPPQSAPAATTGPPPAPPPPEAWDDQAWSRPPPPEAWDDQAWSRPVPPEAWDDQARSRAAPPAPPAREEPVRPEAAWAVLWADLADTGRRPGDGPTPAGDDGDDLMAVANAVQARRRVRLLRR
jgi:hypothetical protein